MQSFIIHGFLWTVLASVLLCCGNGNLSFAADAAESGRAQFVADKGSSGITNKQNISWYSYENGLARAKAENKKIFLHFYTNWCHYCKVMVANTFVNKDVINLLNEKFISIRVNRDEKPSLKTKYPGLGVPSSWFLDSNGDKIGVKPGYLPPEQFIPILQFVASEEYKSYQRTD